MVIPFKEILAMDVSVVEVSVMEVFVWRSLL